MQASISIANQIANIPIALDFCEELSDKWEINPKVAIKLSLALDEILSNTINYGYTDDREHKIDINFSMFKDSLSAEIIDDGAEFNPLLQDAPDLDPDLENRKIGGLGIHLVKSFADSLSYSRENDKNILLINISI